VKGKKIACHELTNSLSAFLLEKLTVSQVVDKTKKFVTWSTKARIGLYLEPD
jgi:hypothetical protein